MRGT
jgi:hypothetical protein